MGNLQIVLTFNAFHLIQVVKYRSIFFLTFDKTVDTCVTKWKASLISNYHHILMYNTNFSGYILSFKF